MEKKRLRIYEHGQRIFPSIYGNHFFDSLFVKSLTEERYKKLPLLNEKKLESFFKKLVE